MLKVFYDEFELTKYFVVRTIRPITPVRVNHFSTLERSSGGIFRYSKNEGTRLEIEATIKDNVLAAMDELNKILYSAKEPKPLYISDRPDRVLYCVLEGSIEPSSRFIASDIVLTFVSPFDYWVNKQGKKLFNFNSQGRLEVDNLGTAETAPKFDVRFAQECGYLALVSPFGHIGVGNAKELDKIPVPPSEYAINDRMTSTQGWSRIPNANNYITDYIAMTSKGTAAHDQWGMNINRGSFNPSDPNKWQGHAYTKGFAQGQVHTEADNFMCRVGLHMQDTTGATNHTCAVLIVIMDEAHNPIMTTSLYDVSSDRNGLSTSFKINSLGADKKHSTIIHRGNLGSMLGYIEMRKTGDRFEWLIHSDAQGSSAQTNAGPQVGDTVYIKDSAYWGYHDDHGQHRVLGFTRGRPYRVGAVRNTNKGRQCRIDYQGTPVYWMYEWDLQYNRISQRVVPGGGTIRHAITHPGLAQMKPARMFIWQAVWGDSQPYNRFGIHTCRVDRIYTTNALEVENVFRPGDHLVIDCQTSDILLNGTVFQGHVDVDSRFFKLPYGKTELQVIKSAWAQMPDVKLTMEERYI